MERQKTESINKKEFFHFYFNLLYGFKRWFALFFISIFLVTILDGILIYVSKYFVDDCIKHRSIDSVIKISSIYSIFMILNFVANFGHVYFSRLFAQHLLFKLRQRIFNHLQNLSFSFFDRSNTGQLISTAMIDTENLSQFLSLSIVGMIWRFFSIIVSCVFMLKLNMRLALFLIALTPVFIVISIAFRNKITIIYRTIRKLISDINRVYHENIRGIKVTKSFCLENLNLKKFSETSEILYDHSIKVGKLSAFFTPLMEILCTSYLVFLVLYTGYNYDKLNISLGDIQAFILYAFAIIGPVSNFSYIFTNFQNSLVASERIHRLLHERIEIKDKEATETLPNYITNIEYQHVSFYYKENIPIIKNFNLKISDKETVAIVGSSGAGKTTIVNLLSRFYEPQEGSINIDGKDYREYSLHQYQKRLGIISQNPNLFSCSIRENIKYGIEGISDARMIEAAKITGAHDFITRFYEGYDYEIGQNGTSLSSGQKQLLCITRVLIHKPDIIILDEATSLIDTITENQFKIGLRNLKNKFTMIIIAHRLSTITHAEKIIFIENGCILEQGTHLELMNRKGRYYNLYMKQFQDKIERKIELLKNE